MNTKQSGEQGKSRNANAKKASKKAGSVPAPELGPKASTVLETSAGDFPAIIAEGSKKKVSEPKDDDDDFSVSLPPNMAEPTAESLLASVKKVKLDLQSVNDEVTEVNEEGIKTPTGAPDLQSDEPVQGVPPSVDRNDAVDVIHQLSMSDKERLSDDVSSLFDDVEAPPTESAIGFEQIEDVKTSVAETRAMIDRLSKNYESLSDEIKAMKASHSALASSFEALTRALERSAQVEVAIAAQDDRENEAESRAIALNEANDFQSGVDHLRAQVASSPKKVHGKLNDPVVLSTKKPVILRRGE